MGKEDPQLEKIVTVIYPYGGGKSKPKTESVYYRLKNNPLLQRLDEQRNQAIQPEDAKDLPKSF